MKRSLLLCCACATLMALLPAASSQADDLQLTLDLQNTTAGNPASGGKWALYARVVDNGSGADGSTGIAGLRALIDNILVGAGEVTFAGGINANAASNFGTTTDGTAEVVYGQDISQGGLVNVGNNTPATQDSLIATGTWTGAARPTFGDDDNGSTTVMSDGGFLDGANPSPAADSTLTAVYTLGDITGEGGADLADIQPFVDIIGGAPQNPAGDVDQNGIVDLADIQPFVDIQAGLDPGFPPVTANVGAVPEPASVVLLLASGLALVGFGRKNR